MPPSYAAFPGSLRTEDTGPVLALSSDARLIDVLQRLAAAAGSELEVRGEPPSLGRWAAPGLVIVGADLAGVVAAALPRRSGLVVVGLEDAADRGTSRDEASVTAIWQHAVALGAERVAFLPTGQHVLVEALSESFDGPQRAVVVGVVGGCGGAGASVLAAALAVVAAGRGCRTALIDVDPLGGGADLLLGAETAPGLRWPDLARARGRLGAGMLREALPRLDSLSVLSWGRADPPAESAIPVDAATAVAEGVVRGFELVVIDLPRAIEAVPAPWLRAIDVGLVVVAPTVRASAAAARVCARWERAVGDLRVVVGGVDRAGLPAELVADALGLPLQGELRPEPGLAAALERGEAPGLRPRSPLARFAVRLLADLPGLREVA